MRWRWDQGRTQYFLYDNIRKIATTLVKLENIDLEVSIDPLRSPLERNTSLPFAPSDYRVWRNYKRVFGASLLATDVDSRLICTELCHLIAPDSGEAISPDEYLRHVVRVTSFPSPVFQDYSVGVQQVFPFCAVLKRLISNALTDGKRTLSVDEVFSTVIGNRCTGMEPMEKYALLKDTSRVGVGDETRQVREMMRFLSQLSFLKWLGGQLVLDTSDLVSIAGLVGFFAEPRVQPRLAQREHEVLALGRPDGTTRRVITFALDASQADTEFAEGRKVRVTHLRSERSAALRKAFFNAAKKPYTCDACQLVPKEKYSWADNLLEIHHLLPLGSSIRVDATHTSLVDLVPVCPTCHRAVHGYYRIWLNTNGLDDFADKAQAVEVYEEAKKRVAA